MKAVIMAGGKGTRLRPLTRHIPKPMVALSEKPVMEYTIELLKKYGITEIAVTLHYLPEVIKDYFGDGSKFGVELHYFEEITPLGTAGSIKNAENFLNERFIVISGDCVTDFDLAKGIHFHQEKRALTTIFMTKVAMPCDFGVISTNEIAEIVRFIEKPSLNEVFSDTVNTGIYILEREVLDYLKAGEPADFSKDLFPKLINEKNMLFGYYADGYWSDVGCLSTYHQTQLDIQNNKIEICRRGSEQKEPHVENDFLNKEKATRRVSKVYSKTRLTKQNSPLFAKNSQNFQKS